MHEGTLAWLQEALRLVKAGLPIPAYVQLLKLSHCFNVLDARGAVGVTLRAACFGAMRMLAKQIAGEALICLSHSGTGVSLCSRGCLVKGGASAGMLQGARLSEHWGAITCALYSLWRTVTHPLLSTQDSEHREWPQDFSRQLCALLLQACGSNEERSWSSRLAQPVTCKPPGLPGRRAS